MTKKIINGKIEQKLSSVKRIVEQNHRLIPNKFQLPRYLGSEKLGLIKQIEDWTNDQNYNYYLGFGGLGDALLLLAACYKDGKAKVVFFANPNPLIKQFFDLFNIKHFIFPNIMGQPLAKPIYNMMKLLPTFQTSAHLADELDYGDWINEKYLTRIVKKTDWIERFGKKEKDIITIMPSGSNKDTRRQRFLTKDEYNRLLNKLSNYKVYSIGSHEDKNYYNMGNWIVINGDLQAILPIINSSIKIFSTDTWLKTYSLLCGIETIVFKTRWNGQYRQLGEDSTDWIFLNPKIWNINLTSLESVIEDGFFI